MLYRALFVALSTISLTSPASAFAQPYSDAKPRRQFVGITLDWLNNQPLHFLEHPLQDLVGTDAAAAQFKAYDCETSTASRTSTYRVQQAGAWRLSHRLSSRYQGYVELLTMQIDEWLKAAKADAVKRRLPELVPLLEGLASSTSALRSADDAQRMRAEPGRAPEPQGH